MITREETKDLIINTISSKQGCGITELITPRIVKSKYFGCLQDLVNELVEERRLIEVECTLPNSVCKSKSILFPTGTKIKIID